MKNVVTKIMMISAISVLLSSCAGLGLNKGATVVPDELSIGWDHDPYDDWKITEVTGGVKWKLN